MQAPRELNSVPDDELLVRLAALLQSSRHTEADLVEHIGEVDARRLYAREAAPSMWAYCTERLHLSGAEAYLRIAAARASREHPVILQMLADGRLHLSAVAKIAPHLTPENRDALLQRATHRSKREIDELVAALEPRPDAPAVIRKLPERRTPGSESTAWSSSSGPFPSAGRWIEKVAGGPVENVTAATALVAPEQAPGAPCAPALRLDEVVSNPSVRTAARPATIQPLAPARYKVQFTASAELREKLERLQALMRSSVPDGDLAAVIEAAVTEKLERLEARRFGRTTRPRKSISETDVTPHSRRVPAAVRRAVHERDEGRCRYVDKQGRRCTARGAVEMHHGHPFAVGGDHSVSNISLMCRVHQRLLAEADFGRQAVGPQRRSSSGSSLRLFET